jgi:hypothetical protein
VILPGTLAILSRSYFQPGARLQLYVGPVQDWRRAPAWLTSRGVALALVSVTRPDNDRWVLLAVDGSIGWLPEFYLECSRW